MAGIMVVDDEPGIREVIATILRTEGHEVVEAADGEEALERLDANPTRLPELILLDLMMPRMDGWRFLETLYRRGLRKRIRVVIITGDVTSQVPRSSGGTPEVLLKPFEVDALIDAVERSLSLAPDDLCASSDRSDELVELLEDVERTLQS